MGKYIDAENLIAEIDSRMNDCKLPNKRFSSTTNIIRYEELSYLRNFVNSLQQEWPKMDLTERNDKLPKIELDKFIDKIDTFTKRYKNNPERISIKGAMAFMARMFYQYPDAAREWYKNLPKVTMD